MRSDEYKNVTMKDIAQRVGVSVDAVSKALRDAKDISNKKKEEIHKIRLDNELLTESLGLNTLPFYIRLHYVHL